MFLEGWRQSFYAVARVRHYFSVVLYSLSMEKVKRNAQNQVSFEYIELMPIERNFNPVDGLFSTTTSFGVESNYFPYWFRFLVRIRKKSVEKCGR